MPRTKRVTNASVKKETTVDTFMKDTLGKIDSKYEVFRKRLTFECEELRESVSLWINEIRLSIPPYVENKTLAELGMLNITSTFECPDNGANTTETLGSSHDSQASNKKNTRSRNRSLDEGYLTASSSIENTGSSSRGTRQSRTRAKQTTSTKRISRSDSRSNMRAASKIASNFKTPICKPMCVETVTPKVKPNTPQVILRHPKGGEMAISMQGSPLFVNPVVSNEANVNIPLQNGNTISIQPQRGLRVSQIPALDRHTKAQLIALRDNLNKICNSIK